MCCNNTVLRVFNFLSLFISIALGVTAAILSAFLIVTPLSAAITSAVFFVIALLVGLIGVIALFFPCSFKCRETREAICRYFVRLAVTVTGVIVTGLVLLALNLFLSIIATPIFFGIITFFFAYLVATLLQFSFLTVCRLCDYTDYQSETSDCGCSR